MRLSVRSAANVGLMAIVFIMPAFTETEAIHVVSQQDDSKPAVASGPVVREVDDPATGSRWLLVNDGIQPGGPGHWVRADAPFWRGAGSNLRGHKAKQDTAYKAMHSKLVIRAGQLIVVEEHSAVADAHLNAVALEPASIGSILHVRLEVGGKTINVTASGPGRAVFNDQIEETR